MDELNALVQEKLDADTEFSASLESLSDEDKAKAIETKRSEILSSEFKTLREASDKNKELAENYKTRAEKAEKMKKGEPAQPKGPEKSEELSTKDIYTLIQAKVSEEDVDDVVKAAKVLDKPISEALKDPVVIGILKDKEEKRKTAHAANTKPARPGTKKVTDVELVAEAAKGNIPNKGSSEAEDLFWARRGGRR